MSFRYEETTDSSARGSGVAGHDKIAIRETGLGRLDQRGVDQGEASEPGRRGTNQASVGQWDLAGQLGGARGSGRRGEACGDTDNARHPGLAQSGRVARVNRVAQARKGGVVNPR